LGFFLLSSAFPKQRLEPQMDADGHSAAQPATCNFQPATSRGEQFDTDFRSLPKDLAEGGLGLPDSEGRGQADDFRVFDPLRKKGS
jgi:hypothetical protein